MPDPLPSLAIEIGGTKLQLAAGLTNGTLRECRRFQVDPAQGADGIRRIIAETLPALESLHAPQTVGIGFGGPVDRATGRVATSHQVQGWSGFPLGPWIEELTGLPVTVENDANTAALGEAHLGAGTGFDPVFYVTLGSGVGGGLVCNGQIYHGATPGEAEIGHLRLDRNGTLVEHRCSGWAVDARIRRTIADHPSSPLARRIGPVPGGEAKHLAGALAEGDPIARTLLDEVAADLAFALSHVVHLFHPQAIVLGGGLSLVGDPLRIAVARLLPAAIMEVFQPGPEIRIANLGEAAVPTGALLLAAPSPHPVPHPRASA